MGHKPLPVQARRTEGASAREVNMECGVLRQALRKNRVWHLLAPDFKPIRESEQFGEALTSDEMMRLLSAAKLSEDQVSDQTIMALAGWMSRKMMERYSHARNAAKRQAVANLYGMGFQSSSPQFPPQSGE